MSPPPADERPDERTATTDGGSVAAMDERVLYTVVRKAVEDAILGAIGTILLVGVAFVVVWVGALALVQSSNATGTAIGVAFVAVGLYLAAATLRLIPPVREWV